MPDDRGILLRAQPADAGLRLDIYLSDKIPRLSRSAVARLLKNGAILIDGRRVKPAHRLDGSETIAGRLPEPEHLVAAPEAIRLDILYEDREIVVVNKPPGMVVHPAPGHPTGTLVNALLYHCGDLRGPDGDIRPGIVHRLDKDTSGVIIVAKDEVSQRRLAAQFKARQTRKWYRAIVVGRLKKDRGACEAPIGRHPTDRKRMSIHSRHGRAAMTLWTVVSHWDHFTDLEVEIKTGRTHQIRVHCAAMGYPVLGDEVYGPTVAGIQNSGRWKGPQPVKDLVSRQLLHAWRLRCEHPASGARLTFTAPLPEDFVYVRHYLV